jgi:DNA-binding Lrp family transcriptional regulator
VRQEDIDWKIYHIVVEENSVSADEISSKTGFDTETVSESLKRLESANLIGYDGKKAKILSIQEMLLKCRIKNTASNPNSPIIIENGVIKENPNYKR